MDQHPEPHDAFFALSDQERIDLAFALVQRQNRFELGLERLRAQFPHAPERLLSSGAYHLYGELARSFVAVLAHIELNLRDSSHPIRQALVSDPAYHLYNWLQLEALLPWSRKVFHDELVELQTCIGDSDLEGARMMVQKILDQFEGVSQAPSPDFP